MLLTISPNHISDAANGMGNRDFNARSTFSQDVYLPTASFSRIQALIINDIEFGITHEIYIQVNIDTFLSRYEYSGNFRML